MEFGDSVQKEPHKVIRTRGYGTRSVPATFPPGQTPNPTTGAVINVQLDVFRMQADCDLIRPINKRDVYREAAELCYRRRRPRSLESRSLRLREVVMPKLIRAILFVMAAQQAQAIVVAAQVWTYQFTSDRIAAV